MLQKILKLSEHHEFPALVEAVRKRGRRFSKPGGDLIEFFADSGVRKSEAARILGSDGDFTNGKTCGHLRDQHSTDMARKVVLTKPATNTLAEKLATQGISGTLWVAPRTLYDKHDATLNEAAREAGVDKSPLSRMVERLVQKGLLIRTEGGGRRSAGLPLTRCHTPKSNAQNGTPYFQPN